MQRCLVLSCLVISCAGPTGVEDLGLRFFDHVAAGRFDKAIELATPTMAGVMPANKLEEVWGEIVVRNGVFVARHEVSEQPEFRATRVIVVTEMERNFIDVSVVIDVNREVAGIYFRPNDRKKQAQPRVQALPIGVHSRELTVGAADWPLPGTLTLPVGEGPFPAVLFVHGSGPHDRDETVGPNKPFRDLAHGLAVRGVASLRYDKRTREHRERYEQGDAGATLTIDAEVVDDAVAAVAALRSQPEIDAASVTVAGHSLGGMLGPRIVSRAEGAARLAVLAGPARPLEEVIYSQTLYLVNLQGMNDSKRKEMLQLEKRVARVRERGYDDDTSPGKLPLGLPGAYWSSLQDYDPVKTAATWARPVLVLRGTRDYQTAEVDVARWKEGGPQVKTESFDGLNHLFIAGSGDPNPTEYQYEGTVDERVIARLAAFARDGE